ncbi:2TM domain-containing protein [Aequorivita echinoideorum]|uniref:2TM domain-containing protein n=1 Tax=Aequorivita echinoideorum TaxID=1549647 RepID=A0ABS5S7L9_9FLAO|nr:2TM domain-containing protein [Aequorivita echinoideorum]MBT0608415.1 2TM domain-containing protein [Aequorivita echinoideorum]
MEPNTKDSKYFKAKQRVAEINKFYSSLMFYIIFIAALAALNYYTNEWRYPWFLWAAFGWGIGIVFKALKVFEWTPFFGRDWEERKLQKYMQEEENRNNPTRF